MSQCPPPETRMLGYAMIWSFAIGLSIVTLGLRYCS